MDGVSALERAEREGVQFARRRRLDAGCLRVGGGGVTEAVKLLRLRTALHAIKLFQNSFGELHSHS